MTQETINGLAASSLPCCGVYAVALLAGRSIGPFFNEAKALLGHNGNWKGRTYWHERKTLLELCGLAYQDVSPPAWSPRLCLKTWAKKHAQPGVTYLVDTTGHTQVVRDGVVIDQHATRRIGEPVLKSRRLLGSRHIVMGSHRCDLKKVRKVYRISGDVLGRA